jgi:hypothetical protein
VLTLDQAIAATLSLKCESLDVKTRLADVSGRGRLIDTGDAVAKGAVLVGAGDLCDRGTGPQFGEVDELRPATIDAENTAG